MCTYFQIRGFAWPAVLVGFVAQSARYMLCLFLFSYFIGYRLVVLVILLCLLILSCLSSLSNCRLLKSKCITFVYSD